MPKLKLKKDQKFLSVHYGTTVTLHKAQRPYNGGDTIDAVRRNGQMPSGWELDTFSIRYADRVVPLDNDHEVMCYENAAYFTLVRGRGANGIVLKAQTIGLALQKAAEFGDGRSMIYAVTADEHHAHLMNA